MTVKEKYPLECNVPNGQVFVCSFAPNGTSNPTDVVCFGSGSATVAYVSTGKWTVTLNDQWYHFAGAFAGGEKSSLAGGLQVAVDSKSASGKTITVVSMSSADVSTTNLALSNTAADRINVCAFVTRNSIPGGGT